VSDWKITKGPIPIDELQAYIQDLSDIRNKEDFPKLRFREETLIITDILNKFNGKHRMVTVDSKGRKKLFDISDPFYSDGTVLYFADEFVELGWREYYSYWTKLEKKEDDDMDCVIPDRYPAKDYFKLLLNSIYGKNCFCVMIEGGKGHPFEATGVKIEDGNAIVTVAPNDENVERVVYTDIDTLEFEFTPGLAGKPGYYRTIRKEPAVGSEKKLSPIDFQDFYIKETFDNLHEVAVLYDEQFYTVMGMRTNLAKPGNYSLYLKRWTYDCIRKVEIGPNQKFIYQKNSNSWLVDPVEALYTDFVDVKDQLRAEGVKNVIVAGVEKELKRVSEISSGLLHLVFAYDGELEHFYSTKNTRLRVREGKIATEYLLDHVKRMHV
jgi:hypothetical protein